jgi:hypothetical protein
MGNAHVAVKPERTGGHEYVNLHGDDNTYGDHAASPPLYKDDLGVGSIDAWNPDATDHTAVLNGSIAFGSAEVRECKSILRRLDINENITRCGPLGRKHILTRIYTDPVVLAGIFFLLAGIALFIVGLTTSENIMWGMSIALLVIGIVCLWNRRHLWKLEGIEFTDDKNQAFRVLYHTERGGAAVETGGIPMLYEIR